MPSDDLRALLTDMTRAVEQWTATDQIVGDEIGSRAAQLREFADRLARGIPNPDKETQS